MTPSLEADSADFGAVLKQENGNEVSKLLRQITFDISLRPTRRFLPDSITRIRFEHDKLLAVKRHKRLRIFLEIVGRVRCRLRLMMLIFRRCTLR